jgi:AmiR/NasT family two-component response regulator
MTADLILAGYTVWEALDGPEVVFFCEHQNVDVVLIAPDVEDADVIEKQMHRTTMRLKPGATAKDVVWELGLLFPFALPLRVQ